jgi:hypothetical protein
MQSIRHVKNPKLPGLIVQISSFPSLQAADMMNKSSLFEMKSFEKIDQNVTSCPINTQYDGSCCSRLVPDQIRASITHFEFASDTLLPFEARLLGVPEGVQSLSVYNWTLLRIVNSKNDTQFLKPRIDLLLNA